MVNVIEKKADIVVVGGGLAGCMAAIRARDFNADVVIVEKANTKRSGAAATGVDHLISFIPGIHDKECTIDDVVEDHYNYNDKMIDRSLAKMVFSNSYERLLDLERYGIPTKDEKGEYRLIKKEHRVPTYVHFAGRDMKVNLTREAVRKGVRIDNRIMVTDLLLESDRVAGVVGLGIRDGAIYVYRAKSVIIVSGSTNKLYKNMSGLPHNITHPPSDTGDGTAMAYRAGAKLINMEFVFHHTGPMFFHRAGRGSYVPGRLIDGLLEPLTKEVISDSKTLNMVQENGMKFREVLSKGLGPIYMDITGNSKEQNDYIRWALSNEGNTSWLNYLAEEGKSFDKDLIEFTEYEGKQNSGLSGIEIDDNCRTSIKGLYSGGDCTGAGKRLAAMGALAMGYVCGENAAQFSRDVFMEELGEQASDILEQRIEIARNFIERDCGSEWTEALLAMQNIMGYYAGPLKSETMLQKGLSHLTKLKERVLNNVRAGTPHELFRAMEVLNLIDIGTVLVSASLLRKETRGAGFRRADYPETDDTNWRQLLVVQLKDNKIVASTRQV